MMDSETGRSKGYGFISVTGTLFQCSVLAMSDTQWTACEHHCLLYEVCRRRMCKKGAGAAERLWAGWTSHEGGPRDGALRLVHGQFLFRQRWTGEDRHWPWDHRTFTANGSTSWRLVLIPHESYGQGREVCEGGAWQSLSGSGEVCLQN